MNNDPYGASYKFRENGPWYDSFARKGEIAWIVFWGNDLLARVENETQARNLVEKFLPKRERFLYYRPKAFRDKIFSLNEIQVYTVRNDKKNTKENVMQNETEMKSKNIHLQRV